MATFFVNYAGNRLWQRGLAACTGIAVAGLIGQVAEAQERVVVSTYSGVWNTMQRTCIIDPFNKSGAGIEVIGEPGVSSVTLTKLRQQKDNPEIDVAWLDGNFSELAHSDGLVEAMEPSTRRPLKIWEPRLSRRSFS
jgi:putative spermidine/putrescine transport system substrate-binding protein